MRSGVLAYVVIVLLPSALLSPALFPPASLAPTRLPLLDRSVDSDLLRAAPLTWQWPVTGAVLRRFHPPPRPWLPGHRGVDLAGTESTPVLAAGSGKISFAGVVASRPIVTITHLNGTRTTYEPVQPSVSTGDSVTTGDPIGLLLPGHPGCATVCLHWGLKRGDIYLDPLSLVGLARVRLLPASSRRPRHRPFRLLRPT